MKKPNIQAVRANFENFSFLKGKKEKEVEKKEITIKDFILELKDKIMANDYLINYEEAVRLAEIPNEDEDTLSILFEAADKIREKFCGNYFDLCTIINAKSGKCSENCKYCAQSAHFKTNAEIYGLVSKELALCEAQKNEREGAHRFSLVTSGRGLNGNEKN